MDNWIRLSQGYVDKLKESPVPVSLDVIAQLRR